VGEETAMAVKLLPSISESLSSREDDPVAVSVTVPASSTCMVSLTVIGGSLTGLMLIVMVTVFPSSDPSLVL